MNWIKCSDILPIQGQKVKFKTHSEELEGWYCPPLWLAKKEKPPVIYGASIQVIEWKLND